MTQNTYLGTETTKRYDIPISHLDYNYVRKCTDVKELEKILKVLRSGDEGHYPELEKETEERLEKLHPKSRVLRKDAPVLTRGDLDKSELESLDQDLKSWTQAMASKEESLTVSGDSRMEVKSREEELVGDDENLPPVRSGTVIPADGKKADSGEGKNPASSSTKQVKPRSYQEWDKFDVEKELEKAEEEPEKPKALRKTFKAENVVHNIDTKGMTEEEKRVKAVREKDKGNEAFHAHDYDESIIYYTRSISIAPLAATYNNRALANLRLSKWDDAINDCNYVLTQEPQNIKALLRRGTALKGKKDWKRACVDVKKVLEVEPNNKTAQDLLKEIGTEEAKQAKEIKERKEKGRRMIIEEVEGSEDENVEEIEVEKPEPTENHTPLVNGHKEESPAVEEISIEDGSGYKAKKQIPKKEDDKMRDSSALPSTDESVKAAAVSSKDKDIWADEEVETGKMDVADSSEGTEKEEKPKLITTNILHETTPPPPQPSSPEVTENQAEQSQLVTKEESEKDACKNTDIPSDLGAGDAAGMAVPKPEAKEETDRSQQEPALRTEMHHAASEVSLQTEDEQDDEEGYESESESSEKEPPLEEEEEAGPVHARPLYIQKTLSAEVLELREQGNSLFRAGQYPEAISVYSKIISKLEKEPGQEVNLSLIYSNRAASHHKTGDCQASINDCTTSLELVPHSAKPLMRRAVAYEAMERYGHAYIDYKHVLSLNSSAYQAHQGASRCQHALHEHHGHLWRAKIPPLVHVSQWDIPKIISESDATEAQKADTATVEDSQQAKLAVPKEPSTSAAQGVQIKQVVSEDVNTAAGQSVQNTEEGVKVEDKKETPKEEIRKVKEPEPVPDKPVNKEEQFEEIKLKGNKHVQKGEYEEAIKCYCKCLEIFNDRAAIYTNRALCYLKVNKVKEAEADCDKALTLEPTNTKAFYRRALAKKMLNHYKDSLQDLLQLLRMEPTNTAAKREMELVKGMYKKEFDQMKHQNAAKKAEPEKKRTRLKIEEVEDEEEEAAKPATAKSKATADEKPKSTPQQKPTPVPQPQTQRPQPSTPASHPQASADKQQATAASKAQESRKPGRSKAKKGGVKETSMGLPVTPTASTVPKPQGKITPYEFIQHWNCLKRATDIQPYVHLLEQVSPEDLPSVISNKLDGHMLQIITRCAAHDAQTGEVERAFRILCNLRQVPRFSTVVMFLSNKEKQDIRKVLESVSRLGTHSTEDVAAVKKDYGVK